MAEKLIQPIGEGEIREEQGETDPDAETFFEKGQIILQDKNIQDAKEVERERKRLEEAIAEFEAGFSQSSSLGVVEDDFPGKDELEQLSAIPAKELLEKPKHPTFWQRIKELF